MKPITCWYRQQFHKRGKPYEFNHFEDGHVTHDRPTPKSDAQAELWKGDGWMKEYAYLTKNNVIVKESNHE